MTKEDHKAIMEVYDRATERIQAEIVAHVPAETKEFRVPIVYKKDPLTGMRDTMREAGQKIVAKIMEWYK